MESALTMRRLCGISKSYFWIYFCHFWVVSRRKYTREPQFQLIKMFILSHLRDRPLFQKIFSGSLKNLFHKNLNFEDNQWQKLWDPHSLPPYLMLVASLSTHFWSWLPDMASSGLVQHWVRGKGRFWTTLTKPNVFLWTFLWKYSESQLFLSLIVSKLVNLGEEITLFKAVDKSFPVNIKGSLVHRNILLVFSFIKIVGRYSGFLGVALEIREMGLISKYTENDDH